MSKGTEMNKVTIKLLRSFNNYEFHTGSDIAAVARSMEFDYEVSSVFFTDKLGEDAAEEAFDITNNPYREEERNTIHGNQRSVSVGDKVQVGDKEYVCAPSGWVLV